MRTPGRCFLGLALAGFVAPTVLAQTPAATTRLPEVGVAGSPTVAEETPVGPYAQPEWTMLRRFPTTRVYVQRAPWEVEVEQWWRGRFFKDDTAKHLMQSEVGVGLPGRFQFDLYENWIIDDDGNSRHHDVATELRWAPADWGKIPLNPAFYGEWKFVDDTQGPDVFEIKLLLGEELAPRWHWGLNLVWEQEVGQERATELAWSQGVSYSLIDSCLGVGAEMKFTHETVQDNRSDAEIKFVIGPSVQWRINQRLHLDVSPLFGVTDESPRVEAYAILALDIWAPSRDSHYAPTSLRGQ